MKHEWTTHAGGGERVPSPAEYQVQRFIELIDRRVLDEIVDEMLVRSGAIHEEAPIVEQHVVSNASKTASGWNNGNTIAMNAAHFDFNVDYKKDYRRMLSMFIHEYIHARARDTSLPRETGFQYDAEGFLEKNKALNEAFTEFIADYVYEEYLRRTGETKRYGVKAYRRSVIGYLDERQDARELIAKVATESGVPEDVVLNAFIAAYFNRDRVALADAQQFASGEASPG